MYFLPSSPFVSWLPVFWGCGFDILACGTYTAVQMTSHWQFTHLCSRLNLTEIGVSVTATVSQGMAPEEPNVEPQSSQHRSGCRQHGKTPEKHLQGFLVKALSMALRSHQRGLGEKASDS